MKNSALTIIQSPSSLIAINAPDFQSQLAQILHKTSTESLLLDMSETEFLDSAGLMALVSTLKLAKSLHKRFSLCALSPTIKIIFEVTQLDKSFEILPTLESEQTGFNEYLVA
ncbi:MAG: STAS domain-containing protein [Snowella sp.]|nr:STAS domain-containing protein [Snowella sp.]